MFYCKGYEHDKIAQFQVTGNFSKHYPNEVYVHMQTHIKHG